MRLYNININLITVIQKLYEKATSAVCFNNSIGDWFKTSVGVRQGCLLSPTLFNILLERIMTDALEDHAGTVSIGGRTIMNLRFANDIDGLAGTETELANLVERLDKTSTAYGMQISAEKTKLMTNNIVPSRSVVKSLKLFKASNTREPSSLMRDPGLKYSLGLPRQQEHLQTLKWYGKTKTLLSTQRSDCCAPSSCPYSFTLVRHGH